MHGESVDPVLDLATNVSERQVHRVFVGEDVVPDLMRQREAATARLRVTVDHRDAYPAERYIRPIAFSASKRQREAKKPQLLGRLMEPEERTGIESQERPHSLRRQLGLPGASRRCKLLDIRRGLQHTAFEEELHVPGRFVNRSIELDRQLASVRIGSSAYYCLRRLDEEPIERSLELRRDVGQLDGRYLPCSSLDLGHRGPIQIERYCKVRLLEPFLDPRVGDALAHLLLIE